MKILVTGATGFIGRALCHSLLRDGHTILALSRHPSRSGDDTTGPGVHRLSRTPPDPNRGRHPTGDLYPAAASYQTIGWQPEHGIEQVALPQCEGVDAVVHLAGEPIAARRWSTRQKQRIHLSRSVGTRTLLNDLQTIGAQPRVVVSASAVGIYGDRGDEVLTETSPPGSGFLSEVCQAWEAEVQRAQHLLRTRTVCLRLGLVLGPSGGALTRLLPLFRLGLGGRLGSGRQWMPWIQLEDTVALIRSAISSPKYEGPINAVAPEPVQNNEFTQILGHVLHRPTLLAVPTVALRVALGEMSAVLLESQRVVPQAALQAGFQFSYPKLPAALGAALRTETPT